VQLTDIKFKVRSVADVPVAALVFGGAMDANKSSNEHIVMKNCRFEPPFPGPVVLFDAEKRSATVIGP
jgi:hypothetical protein